MSIEQQYGHLIRAVGGMSDMLTDDIADEVLCKLSCHELEAICRVLDEAGETDKAAFIRASHRESDEFDDLHRRHFNKDGIRQHDWHTNRTGATTCQACGLPPLQMDDFDKHCPGKGELRL